MLEASIELSAQREARLHAYLSSAVDDGRALVCHSAEGCRRSMRSGETLVEGQLPFVGSAYELRDDGRPLRILVVPKQVGGVLSEGSNRGTEHVPVQARAAQVETAKYGRRPHPRTDHMVGTELALKVLLGGSAASPPEVDLTDGRRVHAFDCMAMANSTLCSRAAADASGQGSEAMFQACVRHLRETIAILEPTVVLSQGWTTGSFGGRERSPTWSAATALGVPHPPLWSVTRVPQSWGEVALVAAYHPSRHWASPTTKSWERLLPRLIEARQIALGTTD